MQAVLPGVIADLRIPLQEGLDDASWAVSGYFLSYALGIAVMGRASDAIGRRSAYLIGLGIFIVGSAMAATSSQLGPVVSDALGALAGLRGDRDFAALYAFVGARVVQGFGAGAMLPVSLALVGDLFPAGRRSLPLGVVSGIDTAGWVLGPLYGGALVQVVPWPWIFWVNLPLAGVAFALIRRGLRDAERRAVRFDPIPAVALACALGALDLGLSGTETGPFGLVVPDSVPGPTGPLLVITVVAGSLYVWRERASEAPLFDPRILRSGAGYASLVSFLLGGALIATLVSVPLVMNAAGAASSQAAALASGVVLAAFTVPMAIGAIAGGRLARAGPRAVTVSGLALAVSAFVLLAQVADASSLEAVALVGALPSARQIGERADLVAMAAALAAGGLGLGLTIAPVTAVVIDAAASERRGMAAALVVALRLLGMMVGTGLLTTYGVRRWGALAPTAFADIPLDQPAPLADAAFALTSRIADEMVLIAAAVSAVALVVALRLPSGSVPTRGGEKREATML